MKTISNIKQKKEVVEILFSDGDKIKINIDTYTDYYLYVNKEVDETLLKEILDKDLLIKYKKYCLNILSTKPYSKKQIIDKLKRKKLNKHQIEEIITYLTSLNLINDIIFADELIYSLENKGYGYFRIIEKLKENNLNYNYSYDEDKEIEKIELVLPNLLKKYKEYSFNKMKQSIYNSLLLLGYKDELINNKLNHLNKEEYKINENEKIKKEFIKMTFKMKKEEIINQKDKIIKRLMMHGFSYSDIINTIDGEIEDGIC